MVGGVRGAAAAALIALAAAATAGCGGSGRAQSGAPRTTAPPVTSPVTSPVMSPVATPAGGSGDATGVDPALLPGMPAPLRPDDVWAADRPGRLSPVVASMPERVYVPNTESNTVMVIDPATFRVLATHPVGREPQHVVPSYDLRTLWVNSDQGNQLTPIDPRTGRFGRPVAVDDPYNLYFTPDGRFAVVMAERRKEIVFRDPHTMAVRTVTHVPCAGVNHADFSADGRYFIASCEFSGQLVKVDTASHRLLGALTLPDGHRAMPQDVKLSPDGAVFYVADMMSNGVWVVDGARLRAIGFLRTGKGAHGLYVTRDSARLLVTNRGEGSISVIDLATRRVAATWRIPGGGSPDMGGLSPDGRVFWVSGRYDGVVYAISAVDGHLIRKIRAGLGPHGVCVYPQPGRYSLGHTGVFR